MGHAIKAAGGEGEDAYDAWHYWSEPYPGNTPEFLRDKWDSFQPPFSVGWSWIAEQARVHGYNDAATVFAPIANAAPRADGADAAPPSIFTEWAYVSCIKRFANVTTRALLDKEQFSDLHPHIGETLKGEKSAAATYLKNRAQRQWCDRLTYRPEAPVFVDEAGDRAFNTWSPSGLVLPIAVTDAEVAPFLAHAEYLFPDGKERGDLMDWCAAS